MYRDTTSHAVIILDLASPTYISTQLLLVQAHQSQKIIQLNEKDQQNLSINLDQNR